ncbi:unnamed protein product [Polarella glacialis]|uniref:Uncharacterized protein n=2 Tax=Polarella glacialis TaxID=89957 RepID=A0A813IS70_POLGL|nr:unnamed protein product [Polarella glacialis]
MAMRRLSFLLLLPVAFASEAAPWVPFQSFTERKDVAAINLEEETTTPPLPLTSTPMPSSPPAIVGSIANILTHELNNTPYQFVIALLAAIFGFVMVFDGDLCFKYILVGAIFIVTYIMAMNQVSAMWDLSYNNPLRQVVGIEAGAVAGYCAFRGIEGVQIIVGVLLGFALAHQSLLVLVAQGADVLVSNRNATTAYFSVFVLGMVVVFSRKGYKTVLAFLSPAVGAALIVSALAFAVTELWVQGQLKTVSDNFPNLTPVSGTWVQFLQILWSTKSEDVGLFAGSKYNFSLQGQQWCFDRVADGTLWFLFFAIGSQMQLRRLKKAVVVEAREGLRLPLLQCA